MLCIESGIGSFMFVLVIGSGGELLSVVEGLLVWEGVGVERVGLIVEVGELGEILSFGEDGLSVMEFLVNGFELLLELELVTLPRLFL